MPSSDRIISLLSNRFRAALARARRARTILRDGIKDWSLRAELTVRSITGRATARIGSRRILIVDDLIPDPTLGAGYPRAHAIVRSLIDAGWSVDIYPMTAHRTDAARMRALFADTLRFHRGEGERGLRRLLQRLGQSVDVVFVSRPTPMRAYADARRHVERNAVSTPPIIYDAEAVLSPRERRRRELFGEKWTEAAYHEALTKELAPISGVAAVTVVSPGDAALIGALCRAPVHLLPHPVTVHRGMPGFEGRADLLFVGRLAGTASTSPNVDAVMWFAKEVMPILDQHIGNAYRLHIAGLTEAAQIQSIASKRIMLHGIVPDLRPLYDRCRIFVAPTRYAAGIPLKVVEAMGEGVPCVVTPLLAEQLAADSPALAIGSGTNGFAERCASLYTDAPTWQTVRDGGLCFAEQQFSPASFERSLAAVLDCATRRT